MWDYQKELGLTDAQVAKMKGAVRDFEMVLMSSQMKINALNQRFVQQVHDGAPLDQIRTTLESIAELQVQVRLADVATSRRLNDVLTPAQRKKWQAIRTATAEGRPPTPQTHGAPPTGPKKP